MPASINDLIDSILKAMPPGMADKIMDDIGRDSPAVWVRNGWTSIYRDNGAKPLVVGNVCYKFTDKLDVTVAQRIITQIDALAAEFAKTQVLLMDEDLGSVGYANSQTPDRGETTIITVNNATGNGKQWDDIIRDDITHAFHPIGFDAKGGVEGVITHEFGHVLSFKVGISGALIQAANVVRKWLPAEGSIDADLSRYAGSNPQETVAEAFVEAHNAPNPRPYALAIYRQLIDAYNAGTRFDAGNSIEIDPESMKL
jgi:hypothetical protein